MNQAYRSFEIFTGKKLESRDLDARNLRRINSLGGERNVSLIGFMGSGKTTAGRILAQKLGFSFLDTDSEIEKKEGMTVNDIFRRKGEASFREKEREVIARLDGEKNTVVACGGGAILDEENRKVLRRNSIVIWLFSTPEESVRRLMNEERPLLGKDDPVERAKRIFQERKEKYFSAAHLILSSHKDAKEVAGKAHEEIRRMS